MKEKNQKLVRFFGPVLGFGALILATVVLYISFIREGQKLIEGKDLVVDIKHNRGGEVLGVDPSLSDGPLPSEPGYLFSVVKDRLGYFVSSENEEKFKRGLLLAEKRLSASRVLWLRGDARPAVETLLKSERYLLEASFLWRELDERTKGKYKNRVCESLSKHKATVDAFSVRGELFAEVEGLYRHACYVFSELNCI